MKFFITDVFAESRYSGNQLATFLNAGHLPAAEMQQIAREINFSETTFILSDTPRDGGYDVRIFTPGAEVDFAGHPTLGTAYIIAQHLQAGASEEIVLNLKVGQVPVFRQADASGQELLWMRQVAPTFGQVINPAALLDVLNLEPADIDSRWPIEEVSTGLPHVIVPLTSRQALQRLALDPPKYFQYTSQAWAKVILAFCPQGYTPNQALGVRVFPLALGIAEDPATGSGNGCLAAYLVRHGYFGSDSIDIIAGQGYQIGRPSALYLRASRQGQDYSIQVGGRVQPVAEGWWGEQPQA
ncbi:MAG: PhzF family phenazine biosynthesis protein [Chloroflexota bacterium]